MTQQTSLFVGALIFWADVKVTVTYLKNILVPSAVVLPICVYILGESVTVGIIPSPPETSKAGILVGHCSLWPTSWWTLPPFEEWRSEFCSQKMVSTQDLVGEQAQTLTLDEWMDEQTMSGGLLHLVEGWEALLPRVWELLRLNSIVIPILMWKGWLGPCHWETRLAETRPAVVSLHPSLKCPLLGGAVHLSPNHLARCGPREALFSGGRRSKSQSSLCGGLKPLLFLCEQVVLFFPASVC